MQYAYTTEVPEEPEEVRIAILDALGAAISAKIREDVAWRATSGIEDEWTGDEEFYQGYDDANRDEFLKSVRKPTASGHSSEPQPKRRGSTVFPNITQPYVDAASARVGDMLLPTDDRNFGVEHSPIPDLPPGLPPAAAAPVAQQPGTPPMPGGAAASPVDQARAAFEHAKAEATRRADKAQTRIDDWLQECQFHSEVRKVIDDCAKLGTGVIKGPVPVKRKVKVWRQNGLEMTEEIKPGSYRIDPWNLFPDSACGESIHNGERITERDHLSRKRLEGLKGLPGYIDSQIDRCLEEGPKSDSEDTQRVGQEQNRNKQFVIWYHHGTINAEELLAAGCECEGKAQFPAMLTLVNGRVIRASLNPLDSGDFPYDVIPWKRRPGVPWGMGVARQMRTPQRIVVAATRNLMDNAGLAAGPQMIIRRGVEPENGNWMIEPLKLWVEGEDSDGQSGPPMLAVVIPMLEANLMNIIKMGMEMAEKTTGFPMLMQGQQGGAPDRVGVVQILNNNGNALLRRLARLFDSCITEPHIRRYYDWLMEYGEDEDEKGDYNIVARGSTALVERDIQSQEMVNVVQMCLNPAFKKNPAKAMDEYLKSRRFDPKQFDYTEEEQAKIAQTPPPEDPRITAAKIRAQADLQREQMESKQINDRLVGEAQLSLNQQAFEAQEADKERQLKVEIQATINDIRKLEISGASADMIASLKTKLADTTLKLNVQKDLSLAAHRVDLHKSRQALTPPTEPVGKATAGNSFVQ